MCHVGNIREKDDTITMPQTPFHAQSRATELSSSSSAENASHENSLADFPLLADLVWLSTATPKIDANLKTC